MPDQIGIHPKSERLELLEYELVQFGCPSCRPTINTKALMKG